MINVVLQRGSQRNKEEVDGVRVESNVFMLLGAKDESFGTYSAPVDGWNRDVRGDNDLPTATLLVEQWRLFPRRVLRPKRSRQIIILPCAWRGMVIISERPRVQGSSYFDNSTIRGG